VSTPGFPVAYKAEPEKGRDLSRQQNELNWMFLSPSALSTAGERTGKFRLGNAQLLAAADGKKLIFFGDFAVHSPTKSSARPISASVSRSAITGQAARYRLERRVGVRSSG
jgi:hypothetical protein